MSAITHETLGVQGAATLLGVRPCTIYAWVHQRRIPFRKHGRRVVFFRFDLLRWSERQAVSIDERESAFSPHQFNASVAHTTEDSSVENSSLKTRRIVKMDNNDLTSELKRR